RGGITRAAEEHCQKLQTPEHGCQQQSLEKKRSTHMLSLADVSARILSSLPSIYLRDDHHDKYDTVALRLLSESIERSETEPRSSHNIFQSLMDRTGCIAVSDQRSQPTDNTCENIFQNCPSGFELLCHDSSITPELEKLFNQTVGASKLDDDPEFAAHADLRPKIPSVQKQTSSLMTPASLGSHKLTTSSFRPKEIAAEDIDAIDVSSWKFPFSRSPSSSSGSSIDDINFEWTLPKASK
ncbi:unnamed protein product, partial [Strongylus vulgaris]